MTDVPEQRFKICAYCQTSKPAADFLRRTGRRAGKNARRGPCRACRIERKTKLLPAAEPQPAPSRAAAPPPPADPAKQQPKKPSWRRPPLPAPTPRPEGPDVSVLRVNRQGLVGMRGKTDKGRRWYQETDLETAVTLVKEHAAVVVNRHTIRRIYSNKAFRRYILDRDRYTCFFCGEPGDTIDHLLPRAKGGHTTPVNCVCACNLCNQSKADTDLHVFIERRRGE
ncbi:HNH endonuclease [Paenibacillus sp.]|uniref:HNH endonuclease n=1 Tax=Paenibacillus sp. TaxID=58172 RepID=UPI002810C317|nr:HNH endonuclease [Paenibacillus sp.]